MRGVRMEVSALASAPADCLAGSCSVLAEASLGRVSFLHFGVLIYICAYLLALFGVGWLHLGLFSEAVFLLTE